MEPPEQDVTQTRLPEPAARQELRDAAVSDRVDVPVFTAKNVSIYYGSFQAVFEDPHDKRTEAYVTGRIG
jgi:ABC-type phosphate transport system ATPase subunit